MCTTSSFYLTEGTKYRHHQEESPILGNMKNNKGKCLQINELNEDSQRRNAIRNFYGCLL